MERGIVTRQRVGGKPESMNRSEMLNRILDRTELWDLVIIGEGATGIGCAVDAASRGYEALLLEQSDSKCESFRSSISLHVVGCDGWL
jgi:glycerol-3-phosphate dehydrogenase